MGCVTGIYVGGNLFFLQKPVYIFLTCLLALCCKFVVQFQTAVGRSISRNLHVVKLLAILISLDVAQSLDEILYRCLFQLRVTDFSLLNKELNACFLLLLQHMYECVGSNCGISRSKCAFEQFARGYYAVGYLYIGNLYGFLANLSVELQIKFALLHFGNILEGILHGIVTANLVRYCLIVAFNLFALETRTLTRGLIAGILHYGGNGYLGFALHIFLREFSVYRNINLAPVGFHRVWCYSKIVGRKRTHLATRCKSHRSRQS